MLSWELVYRASLFGHGAREFHEACDGEGKCVVVVKAENGRCAAAYSKVDGFSINEVVEPFSSPNLNGFIEIYRIDQGGWECFSSG
jgi:hypothetical protein